MPLGFTDHDHAHCKSTCLADVEKYCADHGLKLTPMRRRVLEILLEGHRALGAYDVLAVLTQDGTPAQPPVAYRALDFLVQHGFAHKVEHLNAFVACTTPGADHDPAFLICTACDSVAETQTNLAAKDLGAAGFDVQSTVLEVKGVCPDCQEGA